MIHILLLVWWGIHCHRMQISFGVFNQSFFIWIINFVSWLQEKRAYSLAKPLRTMQINSSLSTITPTASNQSLAALILCKNPLIVSVPFSIFCSPIFIFKILALEVEANRYSKVFQTSLALLIPTTKENFEGSATMWDSTKE